MKALHILDHYLPLFSGYTFRSSYILKNQRETLGLDPVVLTSLKQGPTQSAMDTFDKIRVYRTKVNPSVTDKFPLLREFRQMKILESRILEVCQIEKPDVLHAHSPVLNAWPAIWASRNLKIPVVYEIRAFWEDAAVEHGTTMEGSLRYRGTRWLETTACQKADRVVTICEGLRNGLLERGIPEKKLFVLPNGVDVEKFPPPALNEKLQEKLGLKGKTVLGFIGSLYRYEGLKLLIEAFSKLAETFPNLHCLIVGGAFENEEEELKDQAKSLGLSNRVTVTGKVPHEDVSGYYSLIDILVYPRIKSRLLELVTPLKPLEALSMEKVVVGSDVGGIKELIEDGKNGVLFRADDANHLAETLSNLIHDPVRQEFLRKSGRQYVHDHRTWSTLIDAHRKVYSSLGLLT